MNEPENGTDLPVRGDDHSGSVPQQLVDSPESWPVTSHEVLARGRVSNFVADEVVIPSGETVARQYVTHPGAVVILAMDEEQRIAVVDQYRHPVGYRLIEPMAGLLDLDGETYVEAAQRELAEEARLAANQWRVLVDVFSTPGGCEESLRVFLATDLSEAPVPDGFVPEGEEIDMQVHWVALSDLVDGVLDGKFQSPSLVSGVLALQTAILSNRLDDLRPADAQWPARRVWQERRENA